MNFKKTIAVAAVSALAATALAVSACAETAGLIFQTSAWTFRNNITQSQAIWWDEFDEANHFDTWNVNDVEITADGTYTVSFEKNVMDDCKDGPESFWNFLKLQTNISAEAYPDVQITIDSLKVDGNEIAAAKSAAQGSDKVQVDDYSDNSVEAVSDGYVVGFYNTWNPDETVISSEDFGGKVECTFTITGFKSAEAAPADTEAAAEAPAAAGNTNAATPDKGNADTGVEGVAAIAGIAIIAAGAIVIAKKRK